MKKFTTLALAAAALLAAAAPAYDWDAAVAIREQLNRGIVPDAAVLDEAQKFLDSAQPADEFEKLNVLALRLRLNFHRAAVKPGWAEWKKNVDDAIAAAKFSSALDSAQYLNLLYIWGYRAYDNELYKFMKSLPDYQTWRNAAHLAQMLEKYEESYNLYLVNAYFPDRAVEIASKKLHDPARAFEAAKLCLAGDYSAQTVKAVVEQVTRYLIGQPGVPEEELKAFLVNLNRKCSVKMVKDRESWEPVVTMIRTLLATY